MRRGKGSDGDGEGRGWLVGKESDDNLSDKREKDRKKRKKRVVTWW